MLAEPGVPGGCRGGSGAAAASPASNPPGPAPGEQVALPGRLGLPDRSLNGLECNKSLPSVPQTTSYSAPQHPNPAFLSPENTPNVNKERARCARSIACHSGEDHPQILLPTIWAPRLSRSFQAFHCPPPFPSLLNNRKLSWAKCQWRGRLLPGTGSGAGAVVMAGGDAALSSRRRAPLSSRRSPQNREHLCRGARDAHLAVARLALGLSGVLFAASAAADLASRSEQMGLTLS